MPETSTEPPISIVSNTTKPEPVGPAICVYSTVDKSWHVGTAIKQWNRNGLNKLKSCKGEVLIKEAPKPMKDWGLTTFQYKDGALTKPILIELSPDIPLEYRLHVVCHELGHVLGAVHNSRHGCMNIKKEITAPSKEDLREVSAETWQWEVAAAR